MEIYLLKQKITPRDKLTPVKESMGLIIVFPRGIFFAILVIQREVTSKGGKRGRFLNFWQS